MPSPTFRVSDELYDKMKQAAEDKGLTMSNMIRTAVEHFIDDVPPESNNVPRESYDALHAELETKNQQISELHQLLALAQKNADKLTDQLAGAHTQLEDLRKPRSLWSRLAHALRAHP